MKRNILLIVLILGFVVFASAQEKEAGRDRRNRLAPEPITVSGSMIVARGGPALKSGDVTYYVGGISRLIGFIDGLREGAQVSVEGVAVAVPRNEDVKLLRASKLIVGGKTYDLAPQGEGRNFGHMMGPMLMRGMGPRGNPGPRAPQRYPWPGPQRPVPQRPAPRNPERPNRR